MNTSNPSDPIRFKSLGPGCIVEVQALSQAPAEICPVVPVRRRRRASAGLIVESEVEFELGSVVVLDLKFPEQIYTYRSRGLVSWVVRGGEPGESCKLGVLIFGMDKLDQRGVSVSIAAASPLQSFMENLPDEEEEKERDKSDLIDAGAGEIALDKTALAHTAVAGELISLHATDEKIANWLSRPVDVMPRAPCNIDIQSGSLDDIKEISVVFPPELENKGAAPKRRSSIPSQLHSFAEAAAEAPQSKERSEFFDAEEKMIQAFERMNELYEERDRDGAAAFAVSLARSLIRSEVARCLLISQEKYELYTAAAKYKDLRENVRSTQPIKKGIPGFVIRTGATIQISDASTDPLFDFECDNLEGLITHNMIVSPIHHEGLPVGVIEMRNSPRAKGFVKGEANLLAYIGSALAEFLYTSLFHETPDSSIE